MVRVTDPQPYQLPPPAASPTAAAGPTPLPESLSLPQGLPKWITAEVVADTFRTFRPFYGADLTQEEVLRMLIDVGNLFAVLKGKPNEPTESSPSSVVSHARAAHARKGKRAA